jgi:zinc protease
MKNKFLFTLGMFTVSLGAVNAQTIPLDASVRTGKLANGFTYYIRHNEEPKNRVTFYLANKVGSVLEDRRPARTGAFYGAHELQRHQHIFLKTNW